MARSSKSPTPIAQLRRLLGSDVTADTFSKRHGIKVDHLKKAESQRSKDTLSENEAKKIGLAYGVRPALLRQKDGPLIGLDGKPASTEKIDAWQKHAMSEASMDGIDDNPATTEKVEAWLKTALIGVDSDPIDAKHASAKDIEDRLKRAMEEVDGKPATSQRIEAWLKYAMEKSLLDAVHCNHATTKLFKGWLRHAIAGRRLKEEHEKSLAFAAARQVYELFRAAGQTGRAFALAASFTEWKEAEMRGKGERNMARALEEREEKPRFVKKGFKSVKQLRHILGEYHPLLREHDEQQLFDTVVTCREKAAPLISFEEFPDHQQHSVCKARKSASQVHAELGLVIGKRSRHYEVKLRSKGKVVSVGRAIKEKFSCLIRESGTWKALSISSTHWPQKATST